MSYSLQSADIEQLPQGSTKPYSVGFLDSTQIGMDWSCRIQVRVKSTKELAGVDREVTTKNQDNTRFLTMLTETETNALNEGTVYVVGMEMYNSVTGEVIEGFKLLKITESWVNRN